MINKEIRVVEEKVNINDLTEDELNSTPNHFFNEITIVNILDTSQNNNVLQTIINKLKKNGILKINGTDMRAVCRDVHYGRIDLNTASSIINKINNFNTISSFKNYFLNDEWKIHFIGLKNYNYFIEVKKL